jgi:hypothetical protein
MEEKRDAFLTLNAERQRARLKRAKRDFATIPGLPGLRKEASGDLRKLTLTALLGKGKPSRSGFWLFFFLVFR